MKINVSKPNEWGCFIESDSLEIRELKGEIPLKTLVILRKREYKPELSRTVINTIYSITSKNGLTNLWKKDFVKLLSGHCANFILTKRELPSRITLGKALEDDKQVSLIFNLSQNEIFELKITEEMLGGKKPKEVIGEIISDSNRNFSKEEIETQWRIEYAPNGRSLCKGCKRQIKEKEIRLGDIQVENDILKQRFYHFKCMDKKNLEEDLIFGIDDLKEEDQKLVRKKRK